MALIDILLPAMGEGVIEATITQILVKEGDVLEEDDSIVEIATDKVDSEVPVPEKGVITEILVKEGDVIEVGTLIAKLEIEGSDVDIKPESKVVEEENIKDNTIQTAELNVSSEQEIKSTEHKTLESAVVNTGKHKNLFLSPLVRNIMQKENIFVENLQEIKGSGFEGRITKNDILEYINRDKNASFQKQDIPTTDDDEIIEMDRMRTLIAEHMLNSVRTSPHVTTFVEADVTGLVKWRENNKKQFLEKEGVKLTFMPLFIEAMVKAIVDFPMINISVDGTTIIKKKAIHIGMATALPSGNLIVPVIKDADKKDLKDLSKSINDLATRSRSNKLLPAEIQGSTITITNIGSFGNIAGTPIINQPNVAILAVGVIQKKPAVVETPEGDAIAIRRKMMLSLAYDHRVVDGALGGMFLKRVADYLENFEA